MKFYPTGKQAQLIDKYTQDEIGIPGLVLMEKAAETLAEELISFAIRSNSKIDDSGYEKYKEKLGGFRKDRDRILAVVESGNNGGDAVAAARILKTWGYDTYIYEINGISSKTQSYIKQIEIAKNLGVGFVDLKGKATDEDCGREISDYRIIIDGLFGVGLSRELRGVHREVVEQINEASEKGSFVIGTDIPSGISSSTGQVLGAAVRCDATVTFQYIKYGMLTGAGREYSGEIICRDIGLYKIKTANDMKHILDLGKPDAGDIKEKIIYEFDDEDVSLRIPPRRDDSNKGTYGKVLILAGSEEVYGALELCSKACYKMGAGLVKVVTHSLNRDVLADKIPEAMMLTYDSGKMEEDGFWDSFRSSIQWADVIMAGPGLGTGEMSTKLLEYLVSQCVSGQRIILDADALNILSTEDPGEVLSSLKNKLGYEQVILTPHVMEMLRLRTGLRDYISIEDEMTASGFAGADKIKYIKENAFETAKLFSDRYGVICILKDARTVVSCTGYLSDKKEALVYLNTTGNNGMSTGGSGDVLTGILAGILATSRDERMTVYESACLAVSIHGRAGDVAAVKKGRHSMMATDIVENISGVIGNIPNN